MEKLSKRDEIIHLAFQVFYTHGFHATAVDKLLADSGISKRTLYKYFPSKDVLIQEAIGFYQQHIFENMSAELEKRCNGPVDKLLTIFDIRKELLASGDFSGCFAINAKLEFEGKSPEIQAACDRFIAQLEAFVLSLCQEAGFENPEKLARQYMVLLDGTIVYGQAKRDPMVAEDAKEIFQGMLACSR